MQFRETFYVSNNQLMKNKASHKGMKSAAYETIFGSPTAAGLITLFFLMHVFRLYRQNYLGKLPRLQLRMVEILGTFVGNEDMEYEGEN
jgi:hypothetical protein